MAGQSVYLDLLKLSVFFGSLWLAGWFCREIEISAIIGQILVGVLLGPNGLDFVPLFQTVAVEDDVGLDQLNRSFVEAEYTSDLLSIVLNDSNQTWKSTETLTQMFIKGSNWLVFKAAAAESSGLNFLEMLGQLGVTLLILESGMHVDFKAFERVGMSALLVGVIGTFLPLFVGVGLGEALGFGYYPQGLGMGAVFAPTSVGIALKLLMEANVLKSQFGQTIVAAAFLDDIFSLVILTVLLQFALGELTAWGVIQPFLYSFIFMGGAFALAIYITPTLFRKLFDFVEAKAGLQTRDYIHLMFVFLVLALYAYIGDQIGSHLLGAFVTGVTFTKVPRTQALWDREMKVINTWLTAIFFGATVAFAIPVDALLSVESFWKGMIVGLCAGILAKVAAGLSLRRKWVVGWAMVGRGEFAFMVAQTLRKTVIVGEVPEEVFLSEEAFGVCIWGLLVATIIAPIVFSLVLAAASTHVAPESKRIDVDETKKDSTKPEPVAQISRIDRFKSVAGKWRRIIRGRELLDAPRSQWCMKITSPYEREILTDILLVFETRGIEIDSFSRQFDEGTILLSFQITVPDVLEETVDEEQNPAPSDGASFAGENRQRKHKYQNEFFQFDQTWFIEDLVNNVKNIMHAEAKITIEQTVSATPDLNPIVRKEAPKDN